MKFHVYLFVLRNQHESSISLQRKENSKLNICKKKFNFIEEAKSSTWRELEAIKTYREKERKAY